MDEHRQREFRAALALRHTPHLGPRSWKRLLDEFGSAGDAFARPWLWLRGDLVPSKAARAFRRGAFEDGAAGEFAAATALGLDVVLWTDPDYPERLRQLIDPPLFLYCSGRRDLLNGPSVAVVGSRKCSTRGLALASRICEGLSAAGVTVVSGMAHGIDRQAHLSGLAGPGSSTAVLGTGLDRVYPAANVDLFKRLQGEGLVVTEFAPGVRPEAGNFPYRNRIVSGLSLGVVVVEAASRSGSRITARLALEQGREVYAVPGPGGDASEGCDELVEQGARAVTSAGEVILDLAVLIKADAERMRAARRAAAPRQLPLDIPAPGGEDGPAPAREPAPDPAPDSALADPDQRAVIERLTGAGRAHIDALARDLGWDVARLSRTLAVLEVMGAVRQWPGMLYGLAGC
ncbi:DNA-processing protein DprA [Desulfocurvus sp. DL9XJH121]